MQLKLYNILYTEIKKIYLFIYIYLSIQQKFNIKRLLK